MRIFTSLALLMGAMLTAGSTLAQLTPQLSQAFQSELDSVPSRYGVIGVAAAVRLPDGTIWSGAAGLSTETPRVPLQADMVFGVASVTKTFTAALVLRLAERGQVGLDDPISQHLPASALPAGIVSPGITIRQLLNHTSGLGEYTNSLPFTNTLFSSPGLLFTTDTLVGMVGPMLAAPGTIYHYGNTAYMLLGLLVEAKYGLPIQEAYQRELWTPLGLTSTFMGYNDVVTPGLTQAHSWTWVQGVRVDLALAPRTAMFSGYNAAGGAMASPIDLAKWGHALYTGQVLDSATLVEMQTLSPLAAPVLYGLGAEQYPMFNRFAWGHKGGIFGCHAMFAYESQCDVSIGIVLNDDRIPSLRERVLTRLYDRARRALCLQLSVPEELALEHPSFTPNPASGTTNVRYTAPVDTRILTLELFDATGRFVRSQTLNAAMTNHELSVTGLQAGVYTARLHTDGRPGPTSRLLVLP